MTGDFTYDEVGATRRTALLPGSMGVLRLRRLVGPREAFGTAADFVLGLGMQRGAGLGVDAPSERVHEGDELVLTIGVGPARLRAPVRVVYVVDERDRCGFAYGTLPGHPECGEEAFLVDRDAEGTWAEVRAFSRPGRWFTRLGGPLGRVAQRRIAERYVEAVRRAVQAS